MPVDLSPVLPEILLAGGSLVLLMVGVYGGERALGLVWRGAYGLMALALIAVLGLDQPATAFAGSFTVDAFAVFMKVTALIAALAMLLVGRSYLADRGLDRMEFPVLAVLALLGIFMMISASDLLTLYIGLELQSLALYVLAAFNRDRLRSTEAGLKYFVLGALSSGMLLYGVSLIYGFAGSTGYDIIAQAAAGARDEANIGLLVGLVFFTAGMAFKLSAVPFHMWTPDVYEGAPTPVTAFFAAAPKIAAMAMLVRALAGAFPGMADQWQQIVILLAVASMLLGALAALRQTNIKRLLAYSSIANIGYALCGLAAATEQGISAALIFMLIYVTMTGGSFAIVLCMRRREGYSESIDELAGLSKTDPALAAAMAILMFSFIGIPPLFGFFGKYYVFLAVIEAQLYWLAVIAFLSSVIACFYYLRIVKLMYMDEPGTPFDCKRDWATNGVILGAAAINTPLCLALLTPLRGAAGAAAAGFSL